MGTHFGKTIGVAIFCLFLSAPLWAQELIPTKLRVRVVSRDAKVLSSNVGGALVTISDFVTGEILARGIQTGGSGDTELIMRRPRERGATVYDTPGAAYFETTLMLDRPTHVLVTAEGPLQYPQAMQTVSKSLLLLPGEEVTGEGLILEVNGFIVNILEPEDETVWKQGEEIPVRIRLGMA